MLIQNGCYLQSNGFYSDQMCIPMGTQAPARVEDFYTSGPMTNQTQYQYQTHQGPPDPGFDCTCPTVPPQQSLLHQILTGKGYKNDVLCMGQLIKVEPYPDFPNQNCCYTTIIHDGFASYPHMHRY